MRLSHTDAPYFLAEMHEGHVETSGQSIATFGHRLPSSAGIVDDGVFAGWQWDGTRLIVENDRYGFYPLFWCQPEQGSICVSPSLIALIEHGASTEFDVSALSVFFRLGTFVSDDTPFLSIKVVPPNAVFRWQSGQLECHARWPKVAQASSIGRDEAIDRYIDLFARAMAKRAPTSSNFAIPISGGRDSRHILLELHRTGLRPKTCVSALDNPPDPNQDPYIAGELCTELGFDHVIIDQQLSIFAAQMRKNRQTHFCATAHAWYLAVADYLNGRFDCVFDGIGGDVLSQSSFLDPNLDAAFGSRDPRTVCNALLADHATTKASLNGLLKGRLHEAADDAVAVERLSTEVLRHFDAPNPIASFFFWNRTRRQIALAPYSLLRGVAHVHAPYLDHDLFDFITTLPTHMLMDRTFHTDAMARAYPAFAHIPYADQKHAPRTNDRAVRLRFLADAARRFLLRKPSSLMKNNALRMKILAGLLSGGLAKPWIPQLAIYLDQLEALAKGRG